MDVFLKKYFWVVNLVVIGLCATLGGRAASHIIEQVALGPATDEPTGRRAFMPPPDRTRTKDTEEVIKRNVFCSNCSATPPKDSVATAPTDAETSSTPQRTSLQLELVSTMVVPSDEKWSMAVIRDLNAKDKTAGLYAKGSKLPGTQAATVLRVVTKKIYLRNGNRLEFLDLEGAGGPTMVATASSTPAPMVGPSGDALDDAIGNHVRCNGSACEVDRSLVDQALANTTSLATAARFVPSIKDGRPNGFKLYAIRPSSLFGRIGLQNGDTIKQINGMEMNSPDQALGVYTKVRSASHLTVAIERRGETVTMDYTIR
jgi:general secretion pathway protein C